MMPPHVKDNPMYHAPLVEEAFSSWSTPPYNSWVTSLKYLPQSTSLLISNQLLLFTCICPPPQRHPLNSWDEQVITHNLLNHPLYRFLLVGDFHEDIFLGGRLHHGTHTSPTPTNVEWHHFTKHLRLSHVFNHSMYSRQGGENYSIMSLISGFYSTTNISPLLIGETQSHFNLNVDHFPVFMRVRDPKLEITKWHHIYIQKDSIEQLELAVNLASTLNI